MKRLVSVRMNGGSTTPPPSKGLGCVALTPDQSAPLYCVKGGGIVSGEAGVSTTQ